ncbi:putative MFS transporter [Thermocatellispora tengchongensis]|uniref:Putative MFS transporter n=1 Tax=Thermocatellispora tengchongensis TaxID=1073253 RepID=A0A840P4C0_9ACTN|nr:MFS transporter [Thermocatellispora tengchongensis]MBB5134518.1 putative MFS transporter [Thermocatellispora tengchongensis]
MPDARPVPPEHPTPAPPSPGAADATTPAAVSARLERLPWSRFQRRLFLVVATAWLFDSIDLAAITFLLAPISAHFGLTAAEAGLLGSAGFAGMLAGAVSAGALADRFGRRRVFQYSIVVWGVASLGLVFAPDLPTLLACRFVLGIGMGAEFPVAAALLAEFMPASRRGRYAALLEGAWPVGFVLAGALAYVIVPAAGWRAFFALQACLALWALVIRRGVPESPRWLASRGLTDQAGAVMAAIEHKVTMLTGRALPEPVITPVTDAGGPGGLRALFVRGRRRRTLMVWLTWFAILFGYYGLTTWMGKLLADNGSDIAGSIGFIVLMALWGVPGFLSAAYLIEVVGRRTCLAGYTVASAVAAFLYGQASGLPELIGYGSVLQFMFFGMWSSLYAFTPELFPTRIRGTGVGTATAAGRLGALLGPVVVPALLAAGGAPLVFTASAGLFVLAAVVVVAFLPETRRAVLEDIAP